MCIVSCAGNQLTPSSLRCEYQNNPEVMDETNPRLSWVNLMGHGASHGIHQTAWQLQVASTEDLLKLGKADVWDSGKVKETSAPFVRYAGPELHSAQKYWWRVRVWDDEDEVSSWSEDACWSTGILSPDEWKAQWIGAPWDKEGPRDIVDGAPLTNTSFDEALMKDLQQMAPSTPAPLLRRKFNISKEVVSARLLTTGLGYFELYLNGEKVSDDLLTPNQTDYSERVMMEQRRLPLHLEAKGRRVMYLGYDLTHLLQQGENVLGCMLGNGFFNAVQVWTAGYGSPRFIGQLEIRYADGTQETLVSDENWQVRESAVRENDVFGGETYDARFETSDWCQPDASDEGWEQAVLREPPTGALVAQNGPHDRVVNTLKPISVEKVCDRCYVVQFPAEISGRLRLCHIANEKGDTIRIKYKDASVAGYNYNGQNTYVCGGGGDEEYAAHFTWFVFHTVQIDNWAGDLTEDNVLAEAVSTDVPVAASFTCSNDTLNRLVEMWQRTQMNNMHGSIPSDCPHRERGPYTGDGQLTCSMVLHNFDAGSFYRKWIEDIRCSQDSITGYVPNGSPWEPGCGGGVGWGIAMTTIPWEFYVATGDRSLLEEYYASMKAQTDYMGSWETPDGTMFAHVCDDSFIMNLGEHLAPYTTPEQEAVHTYCWWLCCDCMAKAAKVLGKEDEAVSYAQQALRIRDAYHHRYYDASRGSYGEDEYDVFALRMGVPDSVKERVVQDLKEQVIHRDCHVLTGYIGTRIFFEVLSECGLHELAYQTLAKGKCPGYVGFLDAGSTTFWEQWGVDASHDHSALGSGMVWLYRYMMGVKADWEYAGYGHFEISPYLPQDMTFADYTLPTSYGPLRVKWEKSDENMCMEVTVPEGCTATLIWPVSGQHVQGLDDSITDEPDTYTLQSGYYSLRGF